MSSSPRAGTPSLALLLLAGLAACGGGGPEPVADLCPRVAIINGLDSLERRAPDGSGAVVYRAALENIDGRCLAQGDDLQVDIALDLVVQPRPGLANRELEIPYFVAVSAPNGDVLDRQDYVARVTLPPGARSGGVTETFSQRFVGRAQGAAGHQVLFGFALPADEALRQRRGL